MSHSGSMGSGPLLDRIDIHVELPRVDYQKLSDDHLGEASEVIQKRIEASMEIQRHRFADGRQPQSAKLKIGAADIVCNADMRVREVRQFCKLDGAEESQVRAAMNPCPVRLTVRKGWY